MIYKIDSNKAEPAYLQLYQQIVRDIVSQLYPYGSKLPSKRILAAETGLSLITIEHAIELLVDEGYIESRMRSGYFVVYKEIDFNSTNIHKESVTIVKQNNYHSEDMFPYSILAKSMRKVINDYGEQIMLKSENKGSPVLIKQIQKYLARSRGIIVDSNQIIIGSGAEYLYGIIGQLFFNGCIAIEKPSYSKIKGVYQNFGIKIQELELQSQGISYQDLKMSKADVLHVTPFHSYPSGISVSISKKKEYIRWANHTGGFIVEDNYDSELTVSSKQEDTLYQMSEEDNVIYLNTFSSTIAPSLRVGYMLLPKKLLDQFERKIGFYSCTVPLFEQYVIAQLLSSGDFERHLNRVRRAKRKNLTK